MYKKYSRVLTETFFGKNINGKKRRSNFDGFLFLTNHISCNIITMWSLGEQQPLTSPS